MIDPSVKKKPAADFYIRMVRSGLRPWNVPLRTLARVLEATQRLVDPPTDDVPMYADEGIDEAGDEDAVSVIEKPSLRLVDIKFGSAGYAVVGAEALPRLIHTGESIKNPSDADWAASEIRSLDELSAIAKSLECVIEYRIGSLKDGDVIAKITPTTFSDVEENAFVEGETSVIGTIERVGGATKLHCGLRVADQSRMLICEVSSADLARRLGQFLYQTVLVSGRARWLRRNWQLKRISISDFEPPKTGSFVKSLQAAYDAGAHVWDKIEDPEKYIADLRG